MRSKLVNEHPRTYVVVFSTGDEVVSGITYFAIDNGLSAAGITAIGAFNDVDLGYFDFTTKDYKRIPLREQVEVLSLIGNIVLYDTKPKLHAHVVLGKVDGTAYGGHLMEAYVNPTLEVIITELPGYLHREMDKSIGIPLIKL